MRRRLLALMAVVALISAACGGDSDEPAAQSGQRPTTTAERGGAGPGSTLELTAQGIAFDKAALRASPGAVSIRFHNQDQGIPHNLHVSGTGLDDKTEIEAGPTTQTLDLSLRTGTYSYVCDVHPQQMTGQLTVT